MVKVFSSDIRISQESVLQGQERVYNSPLYALPYFVEMTTNCLDVKAQFRYLNSELLQNIESGGILMASKIRNDIKNSGQCIQVYLIMLRRHKKALTII